MQSKSLTQQFLALLRVSRLTREIMEEQKKEYERNPKSYNHYYQEYVRTQRLSKIYRRGHQPR